MRCGSWASAALSMMRGQLARRRISASSSGSCRRCRGGPPRAAAPARSGGARGGDEVTEGAAKRVVVISDVSGEIGPRTVRFLERSIDLVAELGGGKQGLLARLPIVGQHAARWVEDADVNEAALVERRER